MKNSVTKILAAVIFCSVSGIYADPALGQAVFKSKCQVCHTVEMGKHKIGPSLFGVVGRKAGTVPGYKFSAAVSGSGEFLDAVLLLKFFEDSKKVFPGNKEVFPGIKDPKERADLLEYLQSLK